MMVATNQRAKGCLISFLSVVVFTPAASGQETKSDQDIEKQVVIEPMVVTGRLYAEMGDAALPSMVLSGDELAHRRRGTIGETLDGLPGVHMDSFGAGASRPVIRGQTLPRIEILSDGANLFDAASVSPDHAVVTDPLLLDAIEIQRGPAAVRYGGSAVNGAINLIDGKIPRTLPEGGISGDAEMRLGTADEEQSGAGRVTTAIGPIAFHVEGSYSTRGNYNVPSSFGSDELKDSFADNSSFAFGTSWVTDKGYIGAAYTRQDAKYGLPGHSHLNNVCHNHGSYLHCETHDNGNYSDSFDFSDDHTAYIDLRSERVDIRADYTDPLPGFEAIRLRASYTDYVHDEIDGTTLFSRYTNETWDGRIELTHNPLLGFTGTFGMQYTDGTFSGIDLVRAHLRDDSMDFLTKNTGIFLSERRSFGPVDVEIAARQDWRKMTPDLWTYDRWIDFVIPADQPLLPHQIPIMEQLYDQLHTSKYPGSEVKPFSASVGATWYIDNDYSLSLSLSRNERPANVRELYAFGNNLATNSYEIGLAQYGRSGSLNLPDRPDVMETAKSLNLTFRKEGGPLEFEVGVFYQDVDDYIFLHHIDTAYETGIPHNYQLYTTADVAFTGIDGQISYRVTPEARVTVFGDYVDTDLKAEPVRYDTDYAIDNLPRMSPARLGARFDWASGPVTADLEYYHTFMQDKVAVYETPTDGYGMLNATLAYSLDMNGWNDLELYLRGSNLTNELAFVHTSFVKDQSPLRGRNFVAGMRYLF